MTVDELSSFLEAHEQRKKKKKQEVLEEALEVKTTLKKDKSGNAEGITREVMVEDKKRIRK
jgi:hypothetical protein